WRGTSPLSRAPLSGGLLAVVEGVLSDTYDSAPIGSQIVTTPEDPEDENGTIGASFRGKRGRVLLRETSAILAAGGPTPQSDWSPRDMTPDIARAGLPASHALTRSGLVSCFGVLPALLDPQASAQAIREAQRHLAQWTLQPIAGRMGDEITAKTGQKTTVDVVQAVHAYDGAGRARALATTIDALAAAKEAGIPIETVLAMQSAGNWDQSNM